MKKYILITLLLLIGSLLYGQHLQIESKETIFGKKNGREVLRNKIISCLQSYEFDVMDSIGIRMDADVSKGNSLKGLYFAFLNANLKIEIHRNGVKARSHQKSFSNIKGGGTNFTQAADKAYQKGVDEICSYLRNTLTNFYAETEKSETSLPSGKTSFASLSSDVDVNIPDNNNPNKNKYALIIGNEDYTMYQSGLNSEANVDYARNDANVFARYAEKTLGVPKENVTLITDVISTQMKREIKKLSKLIEYSHGKAEVIFYYAGHGFPEPGTKEPYLIPVDVTGSDVQNGIKLYDLYQTLSEYPSSKITVFIDACFSGGGRNQGLVAARAVKVKPKRALIEGNMVVFSASSGEQVSNPYTEKSHGMFTYFLLKKLQESKGNVTYQQLADFIKTNVELTAIKTLNREQSPEINTGQLVTEDWQNQKMLP